MNKKLYDTLLSIYNCYTFVYESGKHLYELLREKNLQEMRPLQVEQLKKLEELKELKLSLEHVLRAFCQEHHIEDVRIRSVLPFLPGEEQRKIDALLDQIRKIEETTKRTLLQNQYYLEVMMKTTESMVDLISEMNMEKMHNSQLFMNELL